MSTDVWLTNCSLQKSSKKSFVVGVHLHFNERSLLRINNVTHLANKLRDTWPQKVFWQQRLSNEKSNHQLSNQRWPKWKRKRLFCFKICLHLQRFDPETLEQGATLFFLQGKKRLYQIKYFSVGLFHFFYFFANCHFISYLWPTIPFSWTIFTLLPHSDPFRLQIYKWGVWPWKKVGVMVGGGELCNRCALPPPLFV